ncbi:unnamed protein product [Natator depressus]
MQHVQIDFTDLPPSEGKRHLLVIIDRWKLIPPLERLQLLYVRYYLTKLYQDLSPPEIIDSDQGTHFTAKICNKLTSRNKMGQVERMNGTLKNLLTKLCRELNMRWTKVLPLALYTIQTTPSVRTKLAPYEILFGHIPPTFAPLISVPNDTDMTKATETYVKELQRHLLTLQQYSAHSQSLPLWEAVHSFLPGDPVWIKAYQKTPLQPQWLGPFETLLVSPTAIRLKELPTWIHHTRVKRSTAREPDL